MEDQNTEEGLPAAAGAKAGEKNGGMMGKMISGLIVMLVVALGVYALTRGGNEAEQNNSEAMETESENAVEEPVGNIEATEPAAVEIDTEATDLKTTGEIVIVSFTDQGFNPKAVSIKKGDSVLFVNEAESDTWPASAMHPTHTVYPNSDIKKCGTSEAAGMFDACRGLKTGETWAFQFNEIGKWNYHDHLNAKQFGSIEVTE